MCSQYFSCWIYQQGYLCIFKILDVLTTDSWVYDERCVETWKYNYTAGILGGLPLHLVLSPTNSFILLSKATLSPENCQ